MLSVAKLSPGQERYYQRSVADGLDDYYAGAGEAPGVWTGRGAQALGLDGTVEGEELSRLIAGLHPRADARLRTHPAARTITVAGVDPETGEVRRFERELRPVAGFDLVFGAPKSVSLLHALGGDGVRRAVGQAHESAWRAAVNYLESEACVTRRGRGGVVREAGSGFVAAAYACSGPLPSLEARHTRIHPGRPQTNGHVERLHRTILDECWRPAFARYLYISYGGLARDLATYLRLYNTDRSHNGRITQGRIPADIIDPARKMRPR